MRWKIENRSSDYDLLLAELPCKKWGMRRSSDLDISDGSAQALFCQGIVRAYHISACRTRSSAKTPSKDTGRESDSKDLHAQHKLESKEKEQPSEETVAQTRSRKRQTTDTQKSDNEQERQKKKPREGESKTKLASVNTWLWIEYCPVFYSLMYVWLPCESNPHLQGLIAKLDKTKTSQRGKEGRGGGGWLMILLTLICIHKILQRLSPTFMITINDHTARIHGKL